MAELVYLAKDSDDLVSHCSCDRDRALVNYPPQMDCPWCGCGWLFTCIECQKAFTFARGVLVDESWEELAVRSLRGTWKTEPDGDDVHSWVESMQALMQDVEVGERYVYFDGAIIPADAEGIEFEGWHAKHDLDFLPHVEAMTRPDVMDTLLANPDYWSSHALNLDD